MEKNDIKILSFLKKGIVILLYIVFGTGFLAMAKSKPNSQYKGVQIGTITYSFRSMPDQSLQAILDYTVEAGISSVELKGGEVEKYAGVSYENGQEAIRKWRMSVSLDKFREIRKMFNKKGVKIHVLKLGNNTWPDDEIDYAFNVCKALGAQGISMEVSEETAKRMEPFAEKHGLYVILHNHGQPGDPNFSFDKMLSYGPMIMLNLDVGHYFGATGLNPCDLINRLHKRIFSIHVKDKTGPNALTPNTNQAFGEGETPVTEILQLLRDNKWPIHCDIELEYNIPKGSDAVKEVTKCVDYCRKALM